MEVIKLKRTISLWSGVGIIINSIIGSGIFVSPTTVLLFAGSTGMALVIWTLTGMVSMVGALCYAELALMFPESGSEYIYLREAFGPFFGFLVIWVIAIFGSSASRAAGTITFATYLTEIFWPCSGGSDKEMTIKMLAVIAYMLMSAINCYKIRYVLTLIDLFTALKILALVIVIVTGFVILGRGQNQNLQNMFENTSDVPSNYAFAFYASFWAYSGFNSLNFVVEEIKEPVSKNLPLALVISMTTITLLYVLTNLAFIVVLTPNDILSTNAVVVTFGAKVSDILFFLMPIFVTISAFGTVHNDILTSSRLLLVAARQGHLPKVFTLIAEKQLTPIPALVFNCIVPILMIASNTIDGLILFTSYFNAICTTLTMCAMIYLKLTRENLNLPLKLPLVLPMVYLLFFLIIMILPFFDPGERFSIAMSFVMALTAVPVFIVFVWWQKRPKFIGKINDMMLILTQKMFLVLPEGSEIELDKSD